MRIRIDQDGRIALPNGMCAGVSSFRISQAPNGDVVLTPYVEIPARDARRHRAADRAPPRRKATAKPAKKVRAAPGPNPFLEGKAPRTPEELALILEKEWLLAPNHVHLRANESRSAGTPTAVGRNETHGWFIMHRGAEGAYVAWSEKKRIGQHAPRWVEFKWDKKVCRFTVLKKSKTLRFKQLGGCDGRSDWLNLAKNEQDEVTAYLLAHGYIQQSRKAGSPTYRFGDRFQNDNNF